MTTIPFPLFWLIMGVMLLFLEMALPGFVLFFFGLGALVTSLVTYLYPLSISWQLALFIVASLACLFSLRDIIQRRFFKQPTGEGEDKVDEDVLLAVAGERGVVCMTIVPPKEGRIKYAGTFWRATADERIDEGEIISVVSQDGLIIHVEKV
ncbi:NfeD family protein [Desulfomarina sp.]